MSIRQISLLIVSTVLLFTFGCSMFGSAVPKYGIDFNSERQKLGIPIIPDDWTVSGASSKSVSWVNPDRETSYQQRHPVHWAKSLEYQNGELISETDLYYGPNDFSCEENSCREEIQATYYYQVDETDSQRTVGWSIVLLTSSTEHANIDIGFEEAKRILREWDIEFP